MRWAFPVLIDFTDLDIYIRPGPTDLRKAVNGRSTIIQDEMDLDPFSRSLFLLCNRLRKLSKAAYWGRNGFCLWQKRLEKYKLPFRIRKTRRELTMEELTMLLKGIDLWRAHTDLHYSRAS